MVQPRGWPWLCPHLSSLLRIFGGTPPSLLPHQSPHLVPEPPQLQVPLLGSLCPDSSRVSPALTPQLGCHLPTKGLPPSPRLLLDRLHLSRMVPPSASREPRARHPARPACPSAAPSTQEALTSKEIRGLGNLAGSSAGSRSVQGPHPAASSGAPGPWRGGQAGGRPRLRSPAGLQSNVRAARLHTGTCHPRSSLCADEENTQRPDDVRTPCT